jgi:hypothetical protein
MKIDFSTVLRSFDGTELRQNGEPVIINGQLMQELVGKAWGVKVVGAAIPLLNGNPPPVFAEPEKAGNGLDEPRVH